MVSLTSVLAPSGTLLWNMVHLEIILIVITSILLVWPILNMVIFHSYVKFTEGMWWNISNSAPMHRLNCKTFYAIGSFSHTDVLNSTVAWSNNYQQALASINRREKLQLRITETPGFPTAPGPSLVPGSNISRPQWPQATGTKCPSAPLRNGKPGATVRIWCLRVALAAGPLCGGLWFRTGRKTNN